MTGGTNGNSFTVLSATPNVPDPGLSTNLFAVSGKLAGSLAASPSSVDFGGQPVDTTSAARTITVTNLDAVEVTLAAPALAGSTEFARTGGTCVARPDAGAGRLLHRGPDVRSDRRAGRQDGTLTVASTGGVRSPLTVALLGTAIEATGTPVTTMSAPGLDFPATRVREASPTQSVTVTNNGTAPLLVTDVRLDPASAEQNANFRIVGDTCFAGASGTTIAVGSSCTITAQFAPLSNGPHATNIVLTSNAGTGTLALTGTGTGGLAAVGPVGAYGFPEWYRDDAGTKVGQCIDPADPYCTVLADATYTRAKPLVFPSNFPGEFFYQVADAATTVNDPTCATGTGNAKMRTALEASFATGAPVDGDQMTFGRIRFSVAGGGLCPNTDYVFTSPYGADLFTTDGSGALKPAAGTQDVGCVPAPPAPCDWEIALSSRVLSSFVMWDPAVAPAAPAGYLGDAATFHTITGAPYSPDGMTPANYFRISRQAGDVEVGRTDQFTVMGKLRGPLEATPSAVDFGAVATGTTVSGDPGDPGQHRDHRAGHHRPRGDRGPTRPTSPSTPAPVWCPTCWIPSSCCPSPCSLVTRASPLRPSPRR